MHLYPRLTKWKSYLKCYGISGWVYIWLYFVLQDSSTRWKVLEKYRVNAGVSLDFTLGPTLFPLYINDLPDNVICNIATYADDILSTLYSKYDQTSD